MDLDSQNSHSFKKFVISTEIYHERLNYFFSHNDSVSEAEVIMGINAQKLQNDHAGLAELRKQTSENSMWPLGSICCGLAHYEVFRKCIDTNVPMTIFEDDAILVSDFEMKSKRLIERAGTDWDIIQWGFNWDSFLDIRIPQKIGPVFRLSLKSELEKFKIEEFKKSGINSSLFPLVSSFGMHAYTISPTGARKFLDHYPKIVDIFINNLDLLGHSYWALSLDMVLNSFYNTNNCFIALPPLSFVENDKNKSAIWHSNT